jgi:WD40 repeat protein
MSNADVTFSRDGRTWIASSFPDEIVEIRDGSSGKTVRKLRHAGGVHTVALSADGKFVLSGGEDGRAVLWRTSDGALRTVFPHQGPVWKATFSGSGRYGATIAADGIARVWLLSTGQELGRVRYDSWPRALDFTPDERLLLIASNWWAHLFRFENGVIPSASRELAGRWSGEYRILAPDGSRVLVVTAVANVGYRMDVLRFDTVDADPAAGTLSLSDWEARTALRFEGDDVVPAALARAVTPAAAPMTAAEPSSPVEER